MGYDSTQRTAGRDRGYREHSKPRPRPWEITDSLQSGRRRMSDSRGHRRSARSGAEQRASPAWKSKSGFQLPPDVSYEKQRLSDAWAYVFRHRVLGELGGIGGRALPYLLRSSW